MNAKSLIKTYWWIVLISSILILVTVYILFFVSSPANTESVKDSNISTNKKKTSYPISYNNFVVEEYGDIHKKYLNDNITESSSFPFSSDYYDQYTYGNLLVGLVNFKFLLIDASIFKSNKELLEKMYLSDDQTSNLVASKSINLNGLDLEMILMNVPVGPYTYKMAGSFIKDGKGYYFQTYIGRASEFNITEENFEDLFNFNHIRSPKEILNILSDLSHRILPSEYFKPFNNSELQKESVQHSIDIRRNIDNFPTTF